jgi:hypothetical protein
VKIGFCVKTVLRGKLFFLKKAILGIKNEEFHADLKNTRYLIEKIPEKLLYNKNFFKRKSHNVLNFLILIFFFGGGGTFCR